MTGRGFSGRILHVDLSNHRTWVTPLNETFAEEYIGGLGICVRLASEFIPVGADPLSEQSAFVIGAGPMVGTDLPSSSRIYVITKLPASNTIGWCGAGGYRFGAQLKYAGYDHVIISGASINPVSLHIHDDRVDIRNAKNLWGLNVEQTCDTIYRDFDAQAGVLAIGPAGENRCAFSLAFVDRISTLGRGGFGAVMGSKNLKAVVVRGTGGVAVADPKRFNRLSRRMLKAIRDYEYLKEWQDLGMLKSFPIVPKDLYDRLKPRRTACVSCPVGCKEVVRIPDGPFAGLVKHTTSAINLFTPLIYGMKDPWEAIKLVSDLDAYGMDMFEFFGLMEMTRKLVAFGVIEPEPEAPEINLTSLDSMTAWAERIARRQGTGDLLANGFSAVIAKLGPEAKTHAPALVKGIHPYAGPGAALPWDRFGTMELGQVMDPRGPHVGSGGSPTYFAIRPLGAFPKHLKRMGVPEAAVNRILGSGQNELSVGRLLRYSHRWFALLGSLGICARAQVNRFYNADFCAEAYEAATGIPTSTVDLCRRADRVWTALRELNIREGWDASKEALPEQWFKDPGFKEYLTGKPLSRQKAERMKQDYFEEWGWR